MLVGGKPIKTSGSVTSADIRRTFIAVLTAVLMAQPALLLLPIQREIHGMAGVLVAVTVCCGVICIVVLACAVLPPSPEMD